MSVATSDRPTSPATKRGHTHLIASCDEPDLPAIALCGYVVGGKGSLSIPPRPRGDHCPMCLSVVADNGWSFGSGGAA